MSKIALIFGGSGQDGSFMAKLLIKKKYKVISISRNLKKKSNHKKLNIENLTILKKLNYYSKKEIERTIKDTKCNEIYFFSGQSSPAKSYINSYETIISNLIPVYYILETLKKSKKRIKFFNSSSCEIFQSSKKKQNEKSLKSPSTPYGLSKLISLNLTKFYREKFNLHCFSGIMFHHESVLRKKNYVIPKIINSAKLISKNKKKKLILGNINIVKDWGWASEYISLIYRLMQRKEADDFVVATGRSVSIKYTLKKVFKYFNLNWKNHVIINKKFFRKKDIIYSRANISKIKKKLNWSPKFYIDDVLKKLILYRN